MTNPVSDYFQTKEAAKADRKENELRLWHAWKNSNEDPRKLQPLLKLYGGLLSQKMTRWKAPTVPAAVFKAELETQLIKAFKTYDPNRGAALNTHVENRLPKAMRYNNRYQNVAAIPEEKARWIGKITNATSRLQEELGREPTHEEIGNHLGMNAKKVKTIMDAQKKFVPMGRSAGEDNYDYRSGSEVTAHEFEDSQIAIATQILPQLFPKQEHQDVYKHIFGVDGYKQISSTSALAKKLGKSDSQISRMKKHVGQVLRTRMGFDHGGDEEDNE